MQISPLLVFLLSLSVTSLSEFSTSVFTFGEGDWKCYRIPTILETSIGTLLAFAEGRVNDCADEHDRAIVVRRSVDGGASWSPIRMLAGGISLNQTQRFCNPTPVKDAHSGRIFLAFNRNLSTVHLVWSDDDGRTWTGPIDIPHMFPPDWTFISLGANAGIQIDISGRLLLPGYHQVAGSKFMRSHVWYSDDHGDTWHVGGALPPVEDPILHHEIDDTDECQVAQLGVNSTRLLMNARGKRFLRYQSVSENGGLTWPKPTPAERLVEPPSGCQGSLVSIPEKKVLFFSDPNDVFRRAKLMVHVSVDEGKTWQLWKVVDPGPSMYSSLVVLHSEKLEMGILYEKMKSSDADSDIVIERGLVVGETVEQIMYVNLGTI